MSSFRITRTETITYAAEVPRRRIEEILEATGLWEPRDIEAMTDQELAEKALAVSEDDFELRYELHSLTGVDGVVDGSDIDVEPAG